MDKALRNTLRNVVTQCRRLLEEAIGEILQGQFGIHRAGTIEDAERLRHLGDSDRIYREQVLVHLQHIESGGFKRKDAIAQLIREVAFTHLNRLVAYKMLEQRKLIREAVSRGLKSNGFMFYLAEHEEDQALWSGGQQDIAYRHFLEWLGGTLSEEIGVLFSPHDPANRLFPPQRVLDKVLALINSEELKSIWSEDETIGWVYQYFTPKELRDKARKESAAPRNSYEMAFRNQFFTPRYVVEFLVDNTLGRIWYEMRKGRTALAEQCPYLVRRPNEVFMARSEQSPEDLATDGNLSPEEMLQCTAFIAHREPKDPRELKILDPACGSGHFLLYCFDLLETIYREAWEDDSLAAGLQKDYATRAEFERDIPALILSRNLHGIDIDLRATQIAALALWLRAQRVYQQLGLGGSERPKITRTNIVCAEPMPGEQELLNEFVAGLQPHLLGQLVRVVFEKMKLAGEAGSLLEIGEEIKDEIAKAKKQWLAGPKPEQLTLFPKANRPREQMSFFDLSGITDQQFWNEAEARLLEALREYATQVANGGQLLRQLFSDDAARGFAFVDISRKQFDVILMNPPFGDPTPRQVPFLKEQFPQTRFDLSACFVERSLQLLQEGGWIGAITSRSLYFLIRFEEFRRKILFGKSNLEFFVDLGLGVLDAFIDTSLIVTTNDIGRQQEFLISFGLTELNDKAEELRGAVDFAIDTHNLGKVTFIRRAEHFSRLPTVSLSYWCSDQIALLLRPSNNLEQAGIETCVGLQSDDDTK